MRTRADRIVKFYRYYLMNIYISANLFCYLDYLKKQIEEAKKLLKEFAWRTL